MTKDVIVNGLKISYTDEGDGAAVLFLHGWGANKEAFLPLGEGLTGNFRVIIPDLPGFGASDEPKCAWSVSDYCAFVEEFISKLGIEFTAWVGHSFGGRIIIKLAPETKYPPKNIILIDSAGIKPYRSWRYYVKVSIFKAGKAVLSLPVLRNLGIAEKLKKRAGSTDYKNASETMRETMKLVVNEDLKEHLQNIKQPTLLIWGDADTATPIADGRLMEKLIPNAGLVVLNGATHFSYLERLPQVTRTVEYFLTH